MVAGEFVDEYNRSDVGADIASRRFDIVKLDLAGLGIWHRRPPLLPQVLGAYLSMWPGFRIERSVCRSAPTASGRTQKD